MLLYNTLQRKIKGLLVKKHKDHGRRYHLSTTQYHHAQLVNVRNLSCPAVSQIVNLTFLPPMVTIFALKSTPAIANIASLVSLSPLDSLNQKTCYRVASMRAPIVACSSSNSPVVKRIKRLLFPTPLSPTRRTCTAIYSYYETGHYHRPKSQQPRTVRQTCGNIIIFI